ncbi:MAG: response regulator, partial [Pseudomonas sp.]|nr:response regulator [Pseudomonas sp.]
LHQILRNLLSNALKFTDQGEVELQVSIQSSDLEPAVTCLCLAVRDTGIGIAAEQHERIFQAFQQLDGSTSRRYGGTGLGLAITRQLIEALGGDIQLRSQAGQGSEFNVRLPVEVLSEPALAILRAAAEQLELPSVSPANGLRQLQGQHVLLVDDDVRNIYALMALLDELGLQVTAARDGVEALACYQQARFALILMDMAMPNMDGYTATRLLKQEHGCIIPIIALTAHAMKGDREKCLAAGADDYLAKPVARQELLNLLYRWLNSPGGGDHAPAE